MDPRIGVALFFFFFECMLFFFFFFPFSLREEKVSLWLRTGRQLVLPFVHAPFFQNLSDCFFFLPGKRSEHACSPSSCNWRQLWSSPSPSDQPSSSDWVARLPFFFFLESNVVRRETAVSSGMGSRREKDFNGRPFSFQSPEKTLPFFIFNDKYV